jgi:hypothetical protein
MMLLGPLNPLLDYGLLSIITTANGMAELGRTLVVLADSILLLNSVLLASLK